MRRLAEEEEDDAPDVPRRTPDAPTPAPPRPSLPDTIAEVSDAGKQANGGAAAGPELSDGSRRKGGAALTKEERDEIKRERERTRMDAGPAE
jgi:hypothetical protein